MDYLFKNEIETLIKLSRMSKSWLEICDTEESMKIASDIETVCSRLEGYFEPSLRNPSDMKLTDDE